MTCSDLNIAMLETWNRKFHKKKQFTTDMIKTRNFHIRFFFFEGHLYGYNMKIYLPGNIPKHEFTYLNITVIEYNF